MEKYPGTQYLATDDQIMELSLSVSVDDDHTNDVPKGTCPFCLEVIPSNESLVIHTLNVHGKLVNQDDAEIMEALKKEVTGKISILF